MNKELNEQEKEAFLQGWRVYSSVYGPIMEPAFKDDAYARLKIVYALNRIYGRELNRAIEHLEDIRERCCYDDDWAAWSYFVGLCFDMAGDVEHMMHCYNASVSYSPKFYRPYLKIALQEHKNAEFGPAAEHYTAALELMGEPKKDPRAADSADRALSGLISCLTMMHCYREAEALLSQTDENNAVFSAVGAVLYAAMGNRTKAETLLAGLEAHDKEQAAETGVMAGKILDGSHPHFHPLPPDEENISRFWRWFGDNESSIDAEILGQKLKEVFTFLGREAALQIDGRRIIFKDSYAMSLQLGYGKLIAACPESIKKGWSFSVER